MRPLDAVDKGLRVPFDRLYMLLPEPIDTDLCRLAADISVAYAVRRAPRMSGASAGRLYPVWGPNFFGVRWLDNYVWFQEMGIRPFVMRSLQGKTVPMWVEDRDGKLRASNPKIKKRRLPDGRLQVLIFRKAANKGERKTVKRMVGGVEREISVPRSYPGAPGRINRRGEASPRGRMGGQILKGNVGVRWRHPGLGARYFIHESILLAAQEMRMPRGDIHVAVLGAKV